MQKEKNRSLEVMVNKKKSDPIMMKDREDQRIFSEETERIADVTQNEDKEAQTTHDEQAAVIKIQKKTNYLLNEPENYPPHDMRIFYGWA